MNEIVEMWQQKLLADRGPQPPACSGIIGIAGPAGAGKDTLASILDYYAARHGFISVRQSFADPLYRIACSITGLKEHELRRRETKELPFGKWPSGTAPRGLDDWSPRRLLQWLGTDVFRKQVSETFWVDRFLDTAKPWVERGRRLMDGERGFIVTAADVRFANEARACDLVIEVQRAGAFYNYEHISAQQLPEECVSLSFLVDQWTDYRCLCYKSMLLLSNQMARKEAAAS